MTDDTTNNEVPADIRKKLQSHLNFSDGVWETIFESVARYCEREGLHDMDIEFNITVENAHYDLEKMNEER